METLGLANFSMSGVEKFGVRFYFGCPSGLAGHDFAVIQGVVEEKSDQLVSGVPRLIGKICNSIQCILGDTNGKYFISVRAARAFFFDLQLDAHLYHLFFILHHIQKNKYVIKMFCLYIKIIVKKFC